MIRAENAEKFAIAGDVYALLATAEQTGGAYALIQASVPPGGGPPPHTQADVELFFVLEGEVTFTVEDRDIVAGPGTHLRVDPGVLHAFKNHSDAHASMLIQTLPAGLDRYFREVGRPVNSMADHVPPTPDEIDLLKAVAPKYGIRFKA